MEIQSRRSYFVAFFVTAFRSIEEARSRAPEAIAEHISRSNELHEKGRLLMAGALQNGSNEPVTTMAIFYSHKEAEEFTRCDPFVLNGLVRGLCIKEWANMLKK